MILYIWYMILNQITIWKKNKRKIVEGEKDDGKKKKICRRGEERRWKKNTVEEKIENDVEKIEKKMKNWNWKFVINH